MVLIVHVNAFIRWRHEIFMYRKEQCSVTHENIQTSFKSEFHLYENYLPKGVVNGMNVVVKLPKKGKKFLIMGAESISITFLIYQQ